MTNEKFNKMTGYLHSYKNTLNQELKHSIDELVLVVSEIKDNMDNHGHTGASTLPVSRIIDKINATQAKVDLLSGAIDASDTIERNFSKGEKYWYEYIHRGMSIGCQPMSFTDTNPDYGDFGAVAYDKELTAKDLEEYELKFVSQGERI